MRALVELMFEVLEWETEEEDDEEDEEIEEGNEVIEAEGIFWENDDGTIDKWIVGPGTTDWLANTFTMLQEIWNKNLKKNKESAQYWVAVEKNDG